MQYEAGMTGSLGAPTPMDDLLVLEIEDLEVDVLTGIYSEETHLPQPLCISVRVLLDVAAHYEADFAARPLEKLYGPSSMPPRPR